MPNIPMKPHSQSLRDEVVALIEVKRGVIKFIYIYI